MIILCLLLLTGCGASSDDPFAHVSKEQGTVSEQYPGGLYYSQLNDNEKALYDSLLTMASNYKTSLSCNNVSVDELTRTIYAFNNEHPEYFFVSLDLNYQMNGNYVSYVDFKYTATDGMNIKETCEYVDEYCENILSGMEDTSDLERIKAIHDYICENTVYDTSVSYDQDIRSIILNNKSVCTGYVKLFQLLTKKSGFNCYEVQGVAFDETMNEKHAFNLIEYNGNFYWVDVTLDDMEDSYDYKYFLIGDSDLFDDHTISEEYSFGYPEVK